MSRKGTSRETFKFTLTSNRKEVLRGSEEAVERGLAFACAFLNGFAILDIGADNDCVGLRTAAGGCVRSAA